MTTFYLLRYVICSHGQVSAVGGAAAGHEVRDQHDHHHAAESAAHRDGDGVGYVATGAVASSTEPVARRSPESLLLQSAKCYRGCNVAVVRVHFEFCGRRAAVGRGERRLPFRCLVGQVDGVHVCDVRQDRRHK